MRSDLRINESRPIPRDVKAVTRSTSILADRSLELVGNYSSGPRLVAGQCIPRSRTSTPLSISQVIGSATNFVNGINPDGSTNIKDALRGVDEAVKGNGAGLNRLLTTSSSLLDNPDQAIADIGSIVRNRRPVDGDVESISTAAEADTAGYVGHRPPTGDGSLAAQPSLLIPWVRLSCWSATSKSILATISRSVLDTLGDVLRHLSPHYKGIANLLNPVPRFINTLSYYVNNHQFDFIAWSPPLFRIRTPDGLALCGVMNASMPGSCADVNGQPHAVDVALLQYVLAEAQRR